MSHKAKRTRDEFTFSLGGMLAVNSFVIAPVIPSTLINKAWDDRFCRRHAEPQPRRGEGQPRFRWAV